MKTHTTKAHKLLRDIIYGFAIILVVAMLAFLEGIFTSCTKTAVEPDQTGTPLGLHIDTSVVTPAPIKSTGSNRMPNMGGFNTTDFLDRDNDGRADGIQLVPGSRTRYSIGGSNRYQQVESINQFVLVSPMPAPCGSTQHHLSFRYRSSTEFIVVVRYNSTCGRRVLQCAPSHEWAEKDTTFVVPQVVSVMFYNRPIEPGWLAVDNVNLY